MQQGLRCGTIRTEQSKEENESKSDRSQQQNIVLHAQQAFFNHEQIYYLKTVNERKHQTYRRTLIHSKCRSQKKILSGTHDNEQ